MLTKFKSQMKWNISRRVRHGVHWIARWSPSCWLPWKAYRFLGPLITVCIMDNAIETILLPCSLSSLLEPHGGANRGRHAGCEIWGWQMVKTLLRLRRGQHLDANLHGAVLWLRERNLSLQVSIPKNPCLFRMHIHRENWKTFQFYNLFLELWQ